VILIDVFNNGYLELPRQKDNRHHGKKSVKKPVSIIDVVTVKGKNMLQFGHGAGPGKYIGNTVVQSVNYKQAYRKKGHQLYDGFKGDGRHHTFVALSRFQVAGTKQDGTRRKDKGHVKGRVL